MRLFQAKVSAVAAESTKVLIVAGDIEADAAKSVEADLAAVLTQYLSTERQVNEKAKDLLERTGRGQADYGRVRVQIAETLGIRVGDDAMDYVLDQLVLALHNSPHVDEIFAEDVELRRKMRTVLRKHTSDTSELDAEVRGQLKNLKEGTPAWEIEYAKQLELVRRKRGLQ
jgi:uncharacterized protein